MVIMVIEEFHNFSESFAVVKYYSSYNGNLVMSNVYCVMGNGQSEENFYFNGM